jgi:hypothetical protein
MKKMGKDLELWQKKPNRISVGLLKLQGGITELTSAACRGGGVTISKYRGANGGTG